MISLDEPIPYSLCEPEPWCSEAERAEMMRLYLALCNATGADVTFPEAVITLLRQRLHEAGGDVPAERG